MSTSTRRTLLGAALSAPALLVSARTATDTPSAELAVNARDAGAIGDGRADDAPALNAAVKKLAAQGGGVLWLPSGTYRLGSSLTVASGVSIVSGAAGHGYIAAGSIGAVVLEAAPGLSGAVIDGGDVVAVHLSGLDIRGNGRVSGVRLQKATWCSVTRCSVDGTGGPGVLIQGGMASVLEDLLLTNCVLDRSVDRITGVIDVDGTDHYLSRCEASASMTDGSSAGKRIAAFALRGGNHFVSDCVGEFSDVGLAVAASTSRFSNVRADTNQGDGFVVSGGANAFAACSSVGNSQAASGAADGWVVTGTGNTFAACNVLTSPGHEVRYGFRDTANSSSTRDRNTYAACTVDQAAESPWKLEGYLGSSPAVAPNAIRPPAGARSVDVSAATVLVLTAGGAPGAVEAFTNGVNGQTIRLLGASSVSVAAGSTIRTASGQAVALSPDRMTAFTFYNGVWYQDG